VSRALSNPKSKDNLEEFNAVPFFRVIRIFAPRRTPTLIPTANQNASCPSSTENLKARQQYSYVILRISKNLHGRENRQIMKKTILKTLRSLNAHPRNSMNPAPSPGRSFLILLVSACFALLPVAQAVAPPPDGGYPGFNTAEGQNALLSLDVANGFANTAVGWFSLLSNIEGDFNTATGAGSLLFNTGSENTAFGAATLLFNTTGFENTAVGAAALLNNTEGDNNNAVGFNALRENTIGRLNNAHGREALMANVDGVQNNAFGDQALANVVSGDFNTAVGDDAGTTITSGSVNVCIGADSGFGITTGSNIIAIGLVGGTSTVAGEVNDSCYIDNIFDGAIDSDTALIVGVDQDGKLGTQALPSQGERQLSLNDLLEQQEKVKNLEAAVAALTAQLKEQATQIQKVSAKLEVNNPAPRTVLNDK
jgi:hypothetical protein